MTSKRLRADVLGSGSQVVLSIGATEIIGENPEGRERLEQG